MLLIKIVWSFVWRKNFRCMEGMSNEMKDGLKLKLGDATRVTPRNIQEVQASKLGDAQGIPFFINKNPRFLPNASFLLFHAQLCCSWSVFFFVFVLVFRLLGFLSFLNKLVGPPLSYIGLQIVWFGLEKSRKVHAYVVKRACFWLWPMLCHAMLDIVLALCLVFFAVAWLVINNWDCLMCLGWIMRCFSILKHSIVVFSFDALFGLTWHMLTPCYDYLKSP